MAKRKKAQKRKKELTITEFARMGGLALARKRSQEQRIAAARHAVTVRWTKDRTPDTAQSPTEPPDDLPEPNTSAA